MSVDIYCDGASRGNPGPASAGAVIFDAASGKVLAELGKRLGKATNNVAEYQALIMGLEEAGRMGAERVSVFADSQLVIRQILGEYKVKHPEMLKLHATVMIRLKSFKGWSAKHVPREQNAHADRLANQALDGKPLGGA